MKRTYPNYNVKSRTPAKEIFVWSERRGIRLRLYDNFDGGGWNFYIVEFLNPADLNEFIQEVDVFDEPWIENENGHERLDLDSISD